MTSLEELINDISTNNSDAKSMNVISKDYPYLLGILKNENMTFNPNLDRIAKIGDALKKNNYYCPCVLSKTEDTLCPCKKMREDNKCICGLYVNK